MFLPKLCAAALVSLPLFLSAQFEFNPYVGLLGGEAGTLVTVGPTDGPVDLEVEGGYVLGLRVMYGAGQLVPLVGASYTRRSTRQPEGLLIDGTDERWRGELGLAYRLRPAHTSFNLVPSLAAVLYDRKRDDAGLIDSGGGGTGFQVRVGADLYLDFITLGVHYFPAFNEPSAPAPVPSARVWNFTLGGRF